MTPFTHADVVTIGVYAERSRIEYLAGLVCQTGSGEVEYRDPSSSARVCREGYPGTTDVANVLFDLASD
jgi:hypothetical protein